MKEMKESSMIANEPVIAYGVNHTVDDLEIISADTMQTLVNSAIDDFRANRCTSHIEMDEWINKRMGWKHTQHHSLFNLR